MTKETINVGARSIKEFPHPDKCAYVDIETNDLLLSDVTEIHCICITLGKDNTKYWYRSDEPKLTIANGINFLKALVRVGVTLVFHNGAGYDIGVLHKFYPKSKDWLTYENTVDTLLMSCMLEPDRYSGHSIEAYGESFGIAKVQNEDWSTVTDHMVNRCVVDTEITQKVYELLYPIAVDYGPDLKAALTLESAVSYIHQQQQDYGVMYDMQKALEHYSTLGDECSRLEEKIIKDAPWRTLVEGIALKNQSLIRNGLMQCKVVKPFKKDGDYTANALKFWGKDINQCKGEHVRIECLPLNLNNSTQVKEYLKSLGWIPTEYNYSFENGRKVRKSPKLTEDSYHSIPAGLGQDIALYRTYLHRKRSILNDSDLDNLKGAVTKVRKDGRITAKAITCGTPTARYRHMETVCNIPRPSSVFGGEIRETFAVHDAHTMVGIDLSGIEARMLAHYLSAYPGSEAIIKSILATEKGNDFHSRNAKLWGVTRDTAKSGLYALTDQRM